MTSDAPLLSVCSDPDVQIVVYNAKGLKQITGTGSVAIAAPRGLYRIVLDRCGFVEEHLIQHDDVKERVYGGPLLDSPVPIEIARDSDRDADLVQRLSGPEVELSTPLGDGGHDARLFMFIRRVHPWPYAERPSPEPSHLVSILDASGRCLMVVPRLGNSNVRLPEGCVAWSCRLRHGTYRLRGGVPRRDLAVTIPRGRAALVFLADDGTLSMRTARVYLSHRDDTFDPRGAVPRAMESVLWALARPREDLPPIARHLLGSVENDLSFGIAYAQLAWRQQDRSEFDKVMDALAPHAHELPDFAILEHLRQDTGTASSLVMPPLFRASLVRAVERRYPVAPCSAAAKAARTSYEDSVWCTWSPRWWDERWIEPTIERLCSSGYTQSRVGEIADATRLPISVVEGALAHVKRRSPERNSEAIALSLPAIQGYVLGDVVVRNAQSAIYVARDANGREVVVEVVGGEAIAQLEARVQSIQCLRHPNLVSVHCGGRLSDGSGVWLESQRFRESLFEQVAMRGAPMSCAEACNYVLQALEALAYLHANDIAHGRVHPGSLMVRDEDSVVLGVPLIARGDLQGLLEDPGDEVVHFVAPEVARGTSSVTPAADVWSMAASLYFLLTLELPRERYVDQSDREAAACNVMIPVASYHSGLRDSLQACLQCALSARPELRYADGASFRDSLRRAVHFELTVLQVSRLYDVLVARNGEFVITFRNLFCRLTELVEGRMFARAVAPQELRYRGRAAQRRMLELLQRLEDAGVITRSTVNSRSDGAREIIEIAHPALLDGWFRIREWHLELAAVGGARTTFVALGAAARAWLIGRRSRSLLWGDERAVQLQGVARLYRYSLNECEEEFVRRSLRRRVMRRIPIAAAASVVVLVVGYIVYGRIGHMVNGAAATRSDAVLEAGLIRTVQEQGRQMLLGGDRFRAMPYLLAAAQAGEVDAPLRMLFHAAIRGISSTPPLEHRGVVRRAAFSPDGSRVVSASNDGTARVWDVATGAQVVLVEHTAPVVDAVFSADGTRLVTSSEDGTARIWDAVTGKSIAPPLKHGDFVQGAEFSSDGKLVVTASLDHTARIWNATTGVLVRVLWHRDAVWSAAFSADATRVLTASRDHAARVWRLDGGGAVMMLEHRDAVWSAKWSTDGRRIVTASQDHSAQIWDAATGQRITSELSHGDGVTSASFSPDGTHVVTASYDGTARVWNVSTGRPVTPWLRHTGGVVGCSFSPDGSRIVTASVDTNVRVWDARRGWLMMPPFAHRGAVTSVAFSADGARIVSGSFDATVRVWGAVGDSRTVVLANDAPVKQAAFTLDGRLVMTASGDHRVRIWDTDTGRAVHELIHSSVAGVGGFSADGRRAVTINEEGAVQIWEVASGRALGAPMIRHRGLTGARFTGEGDEVLTTGPVEYGREAESVQIWSTPTGRARALALEYPEQIIDASLSRDGARLVTLNQDRIARVVDAVTGKALSGPLEQEGGIVSIAFSRDGKRVITGGIEGTARVWDTAGRPIGPPLRHAARVLCAAFSPEGTRIVTASADGNARVWEAATGQPLTLALKHDDSIVSVAFTEDGSYVVTAGRHTVRRWDVALDTRTVEDWKRDVERGPYQLVNGVLVTRAPVATQRVDDSDDRPSF